MTIRSSASAGALVTGCILASSAHAQLLVRGAVIESGQAAPIAGALVSARKMGITVTANRLGRFVIRLPGPDTLVVAAIGYRPDTIPVSREALPLRNIELIRSPVPLSDLIVSGPGRIDLDLGTLGQWAAPREALTAVPFGVETDVFRALTLIPAVSFSSPLSARPLIRGYDAGATTTRIDGFEVINLYHIARAFSSFPAEATERMAVSTPPQGSIGGGTLAGIIDITGRSGPSGELTGGAQLSLASLTGWLAGAGSARWFASGRFAMFPIANAVVPGTVLPYQFQDLYGKLLLPKGGQLSLFGSRDRLGSRSDGSGADWGSALLGTRWPLRNRGPLLMEAALSASGFVLDVDSLQTSGSTIEVRNRFGRIAATLDLSRRISTSRLDAGLALGYRFITNRITNRLDTRVPEADFQVNRPEPSGYLQLSHAAGPLTVEAGARADAVGSLVRVQPRFRAGITASRFVRFGAGAGRTARLFQLVSDPLNEPDLDFVEYWLGADPGVVPVPVVDHFSVEATATRGVLQGRISGFASRGRGIAELNPQESATASDTARFRFGRSRTKGVEIQVAMRGTTTRASSLSITYVLSTSSRDFGDGWKPWRLDRRHLIRVLGQLHPASKWHLFGAVEAATGLPLTPATQVIYLQRPEAPEPSPVFLLGEENSGRGGGTLRADLGTRFDFAGPGRSKMSLGFSVTNAGFGPVAHTVLEGGFGPRVTYKRRYDMPAIPTVMLRIEF